MNQEHISLNCSDLNANKHNEINVEDFIIRLYNNENEPLSSNRLLIITKKKDIKLELLPSKGLSIGQMYNNGEPVFWEAPIELSDSNTLNLLSDEIAINGDPAKGFTFLKTFCSGVELYGLKNWGMPSQSNNNFYPLHGETSNIPVKDVQISFNNDEIIVTASFIYRTFTGDNKLIWHERGDALYKVSKIITLKANKPELREKLIIKNISNKPLLPDWGYHITFYPKENSKLLVASSSVEERFGNQIPSNIDTWHKAKNQALRTEIGIIHKGLKKHTQKEKTINKVLISYPQGEGTVIEFEPTPYFQTWFCNGGANSKEFTYSATKKPLFLKNWDGMGIEIGSSALDHNNNTDKKVVQPTTISPNKEMSIELVIKCLNKSEKKQYEEEIIRFNTKERKPSI